jgi:hypothetical protein
MPIEVVPLGEVSQTSLEEAIREANSRQNQFVYSLMGAPDSEHFKVFAFNDIYAPKFLDQMSTTRDEIRGYHPYIIAFVDGQLSGERLSNLFASDRPEVGLGVATIANVPDVILPANKLSAYFLHRLAKQTLSFLAPHRKNHDDTRGCAYDLKIKKTRSAPKHEGSRVLRRMPRGPSFGQGGSLPSAAKRTGCSFRSLR